MFLIGFIVYANVFSVHANVLLYMLMLSFP